MRVILCKNYEELSQKAAQIVVSQIMLKPDSVLGFATGSTPVGLYDNLARLYDDGEVDFSRIKSFNLDEYYPISKSNPQSYDSFMNEKLFSRINILKENTHIPNGETDDPERECINYENMINECGGIDLQILGVGRNGHIGFNEPGDCLNSYTHLTNLKENTIKANSRFFDCIDDVPRQAITMGISTILKAKKIVLLASGANKSKVISALMKDDINTSIPATLLKAHHDVILICDDDAYCGARMGVDIGGTNIKFAVVDAGKVRYSNSVKTAKTADGIIDCISDEVNRIKDVYSIKNVGVGTPGRIEKGRVTAVNLPFRDTPLEHVLEQKTGLCVTVGNDADCAALGEIEFGSTRDCANIVLITLGTGIGGGIIINRQVRGPGGMGEIGHFTIQAEEGLPCPCGRRGCWEQYCSSSALIRDAKRASAAAPDSVLRKMVEDNGGDITGEMIFTAMSEGCATAKEVFDRYIFYLARGIESIANIFAPDAVVLAGGITRQQDKLLEPLLAELKTDTRIEISTLQSDAGALGAALL